MMVDRQGNQASPGGGPVPLAHITADDLTDDQLAAILKASDATDEAVKPLPELLRRREARRTSGRLPSGILNHKYRASGFSAAVRRPSTCSCWTYRRPPAYPDPSSPAPARQVGD